MNYLIEEANLKRCDDFYTPESLAWDLLVGNIDNEKVGKMLSYSTDKNEKNDENNKLTFQFEILITIFMELLFNIAKLDYYGEDNEDSKKFIPQYDKFDINLYKNVIEEKFKIFGYCVNINSEKLEKFSQDKEGFKFLIDNRYCRILLRGNEVNDDFKNFSDETYYHMVINGLNKNKYKKMEQIYSVFFMNDSVFSVNFIEL
jgi:hypothetical protein